MTQSCKLVLQNMLEEIPRITEMVEYFCETNRLAPHLAMRLRLALDEKATNAISHGFVSDAVHDDAIHLQTMLDNRMVSAIIEDRGRPFDPLSLPPADITLALETREIGGQGVHLVRATMDEVRYKRLRGKNRVELRMRRVTEA